MENGYQARRSTDGENDISPKDLAKQNSREVVKVAAKEAGNKYLEANGVPAPVAQMATNKLEKNPLINKAVNKIADNKQVSKMANEVKPGLDMAGLTKPNGATNSDSMSESSSHTRNPLTGMGSSNSENGGSGINIGLSTKVKLYIIGGVAAFFGGIIVLAAIISFVFAPLYAAQGVIEDTAGFFEKLGNFLTFKGWVSTDQAKANVEQDFYSKVKNVYDGYKGKGVELDIPLLMSTLYYKADNYDEIMEDKDNQNPGDVTPTDDNNKDYGKFKNNVDKLAGQMYRNQTTCVDASGVVILTSENKYLADNTDDDKKACSDQGGTFTQKYLFDEQNYRKYLVDNFIDDYFKEELKDIPEQDKAKKKEDITEDIFSMSNGFKQLIGQKILASFAGGNIPEYLLVLMQLPNKDPSCSISTPFGPRGTGGYFHGAIDMSGLPVGTDLYPVYEGKVLRVSTDKNNYGDYYSDTAGTCVGMPNGAIKSGTSLMMEHVINGTTYYSYYVHLSVLNYKEGDVITDISLPIGKLGNTGCSTGPHLHFEFYPKGASTGREKYNPAALFSSCTK
jgi:murein DD-endopeptidase MepM/ murein hydrolase activator NlpD